MLKKFIYLFILLNLISEIALQNTRVSIQIEKDGKKFIIRCNCSFPTTLSPPQNTSDTSSEQYGNITTSTDSQTNVTGVSYGNDTSGDLNITSISSTSESNTNITTPDSNSININGTNGTNTTISTADSSSTPINNLTATDHSLNDTNSSTSTEPLSKIAEDIEKKTASVLDYIEKILNSSATALEKHPLGKGKYSIRSINSSAPKGIILRNDLHHHRLMEEFTFPEGTPLRFAINETHNEIHVDIFGINCLCSIC